MRAASADVSYSAGSSRGRSAAARGPEFEGLVLNLVPAEVLGLDRGRRDRCQGGDKHHGPRSCTREPTHVISGVLFVATARSVALFCSPPGGQAAYHPPAQPYGTSTNCALSSLCRTMLTERTARRRSPRFLPHDAAVFTLTRKFYALAHRRACFAVNGALAVATASGSAQQPAPTRQAPAQPDIYLSRITLERGVPIVGTPMNITDRPGYDNQPSLV